MNKRETTYANTENTGEVPDWAILDPKQAVIDVTPVKVTSKRLIESDDRYQYGPQAISAETGSSDQIAVNEPDHQPAIIIAAEAEESGQSGNLISGVDTEQNGDSPSVQSDSKESDNEPGQQATDPSAPVRKVTAKVPPKSPRSAEKNGDSKPNPKSSPDIGKDTGLTREPDQQPADPSTSAKKKVVGAPSKPPQPAGSNSGAKPKPNANPIPSPRPKSNQSSGEKRKNIPDNYHGPAIVELKKGPQKGTHNIKLGGASGEHGGSRIFKIKGNGGAVSEAGITIPEPGTDDPARHGPAAHAQARVNGDPRRPDTGPMPSNPDQDSPDHDTDSEGKKVKTALELATERLKRGNLTMAMEQRQLKEPAVSDDEEEAEINELLTDDYAGPAMIVKAEGEEPVPVQVNRLAVTTLDGERRFWIKDENGVDTTASETDLILAEPLSSRPEANTPETPDNEKRERIVKRVRRSLGNLTLYKVVEGAEIRWSKTKALFGRGNHEDPEKSSNLELRQLIKRAEGFLGKISLFEITQGPDLYPHDNKSVRR